MWRSGRGARGSGGIGEKRSEGGVLWRRDKNDERGRESTGVCGEEGGVQEEVEGKKRRQEWRKSSLGEEEEGVMG